MYAGKFIEQGSARELFGQPGHPYTAGLLKSTPRLDVIVPRLYAIEGSPPDLRAPVSGCTFHSRCEFGRDECLADEPLLGTHGSERGVACRFPLGSSSGVVSEVSHD
jgi:oligopeptide/dipeptide ABC transporter ATP-binding protein